MPLETKNTQNHENWGLVNYDLSKNRAVRESDYIPAAALSDDTWYILNSSFPDHTTVGHGNMAS